MDGEDVYGFGGTCRASDLVARLTRAHERLSLRFASADAVAGGQERAVTLFVVPSARHLFEQLVVAALGCRPAGLDLDHCAWSVCAVSARVAH